MGYAFAFDRLIDLQSINDGERLSFRYIRRMGDFVVSDDTQMSLFTFSGIMDHPESPFASIYQSYLDWDWTLLKVINTRTQITHNNKSWLLEESRMIVSRAPGITCMNALGSGVMGTIENRINDSKGCGCVMRIAPIALYYSHDTTYSIHEISTLCVCASAITHGHDLSMLASYHLGSLLARMVRVP
ncbi:hypothetical protein G7062_05995 [Erysipelothrix sp. HDW6C]|nr:hypothetical protein G7062_05995 [Erysipelothrix sp. HDW6C]